MRYTLEWDPAKASQNSRKHGIPFEQASEVLLDPLAVSIFDEEHGEGEERWVTIGRDRRGRVLILIHTFAEVSPDECRIRVISARKAKKSESVQYEET